MASTSAHEGSSTSAADVKILNDLTMSCALRRKNEQRQNIITRARVGQRRWGQGTYNTLT